MSMPTKKMTPTMPAHTAMGVASLKGRFAWGMVFRSRSRDSEEIIQDNTKAVAEKQVTVSIMLAPRNAVLILLGEEGGDHAGAAHRHEEVCRGGEEAVPGGEQTGQSADGDQPVEEGTGAAAVDHSEHVSSCGVLQLIEVFPLVAYAEAEEQDGVEHAGQANGQNDGLTNALDVAAGFLNALRNGLKAGEEEGCCGDDGEGTAHEALMHDFLQAVVIQRLQVSGVALDQSCDGADDGGADQEDAQDLLEGSSGGQAALVQQEQQDGEDRTDDHGGQIDFRIHDGVKLTDLQAGDQITEHVGDLNGFPRDDGHERAKRRPTGEEGDLLTERCVSKRRTAASDGKHGDQLSIDQAKGDHDQQAEQITYGCGNRTARVDHPVVDGDGPADSDDSAKPDAEKVESADAFFLSLITHTLYLVSWLKSVSTTGK